GARWRDPGRTAMRAAAGPGRRPRDRPASWARPRREVPASPSVRNPRGEKRAEAAGDARGEPAPRGRGEPPPGIAGLRRAPPPAPGLHVPAERTLLGAPLQLEARVAGAGRRAAEIEPRRAAGRRTIERRPVEQHVHP